VRQGTLVTRYLPDAQAVTNQAARTFAVATRLLPPELRGDVYLLYLVMRTLDDLVDDRAAGAQGRLEAVERWALTGRVVGREAEILDELFRKHDGLSRRPVLEFVEGMRQDLGRPVFVTEADVDLYAYRVAGTVGELMAGILGVRRPEACFAARALGIAMQRTNILRDLDEDLAAGRVYLASRTLESLGIEDLAAADRSALLRVGVALAERWYDMGIGGIEDLVRGRQAIRAAALMYREILRQIGRDGWGEKRPWRASVSGRRKAWLALLALAS
jgi:15-cis-phytoene synthase